MIVGRTDDRRPKVEAQPDKGRSVFRHLARQKGSGPFERLAPLPTSLHFLATLVIGWNPISILEAEGDEKIFQRE